jgi:hypothetical protein
MCDELGVSHTSNLMHRMLSRDDGCTIAVVRYHGKSRPCANGCLHSQPLLCTVLPCVARHKASDRLLCIVNTHLYADPRHPDVKTLQVCFWHQLSLR